MKSTVWRKLTISPSKSTNLGRSLFALVGACEYIQRKSDPSCASSIFLRTLIDVNSSQVYIDARGAPSINEIEEEKFLN